MTEASKIENFVAKIEQETNRESARLIESAKGLTFTGAMCRSIGGYLTYCKKKDRIKGVDDYFARVMRAFYHFLVYAKYWEKKLGPYNEKKMSNPAGPEKPKIEPPKRDTLSVVILTKNEEKIIRNCLESLRWVDEIVVVDGESTDQTCQIALEYGAKVIRHCFEGDFGLERNIGNDACCGVWILQLDADEVVSQGFKEKMIELLTKRDREYASFKFYRKNFFMGHFMKYGGWYHHSHHLFMRQKARYLGRVHHQLLVDGRTGILKADIEHYPFQNFSQLITRQNRYTTIEAREILEVEGIKDAAEIEYNIKVRPKKLFWKFYIKKQGFREGLRGFFFSVLFAWVHFFRWVKYKACLRPY